jgi:insertion element IS1 protein InsB
LPEVKQQIIDMSLNASGMRDTARVLRISTDTVLRALRKKEAALESVHSALLRTIDPAEIIVDIEQAGEAEVDEMWSFVSKKGNPRWLWHAIDHHTGKVLASVFGRRKDEVFLQLKALLEPFGLTRFYTDHWLRREVSWRNVVRPWGIQVPHEPLDLSSAGHLAL